MLCAKRLSKPLALLLRTRREKPATFLRVHLPVPPCSVTTLPAGRRSEFIPLINWSPDRRVVGSRVIKCTHCMPSRRISRPSRQDSRRARHRQTTDFGQRRCMDGDVFNVRRGGSRVGLAAVASLPIARRVRLAR